MDLQTPTPEPQRRQRQQVPLPVLPPPDKTSVANQACWYIGAAILATGIVGFVVPGLFGLHLNSVHNMILMVSGAITIWVGLASPADIAKKFSFWYGAAYFLFGLAGFVFGHRGLSLTRPTLNGIAQESSFLWRIVPGSFELGTGDHILHACIGVAFILAAIFTMKKSKNDVNITWH